MIPFGYRMSHGSIMTDPNEAETVIRIFNMYDENTSFEDISKYLAENNIPYGNDREWNKMCVKRILENEKYKGNDMYPQIVSEELFTQAAEMRMYKSKEFGHRKPNIEIVEQPVAAAFSISSAGPLQPVQTVDEIYSAAQARYAEIKIL